MSIQSAPRRQSGLALVTSLIFLVVLTLIGVTAMQTATMEERMAGNLQKRIVAFQRAEATLEVARSFLRSTANIDRFDGSGGLYGFGANKDPWDATVWTSGSLNPDAPNNSRYFIEMETAVGNEVPEPPQPCPTTGSCTVGHVFNITARSTDDSGTAVVMLRKRFWKATGTR